MRAKFLGVLGNLDIPVMAVHLDRGFYDGKCLTLLHARNVAYKMPMIRWGTETKRHRTTGWSRQVTHDLSTDFDGHEWTVALSVMIDANDVWNENEGVVQRHGYAASPPFVDSPRQARHHSGKRFGIEASYRLSEDSIVSTTTQDPTRRLLYAVSSQVVQNIWRYIHLELRVATLPRRASPLVVAIRGIRRHGDESCVEGTVHRANRANESASGLSLPPVGFAGAGSTGSGNTVANGNIQPPSPGSTVAVPRARECNTGTNTPHTSPNVTVGSTPQRGFVWY